MAEYKYYAGIGSRKTPPKILSLMTEIASYLSRQGYILRSGGAEGADEAFERGVLGIPNGKVEIFLPWNGFNNHFNHQYPIRREALEIASRFHPSWERCSPTVRKLHARNCYQVLGYSLSSLSDFVICWTPGGGEVGGTAQAIRIAHSKNIKVYNLAKKEDIEFWKEKIKNEISVQ